MVDYEFVISVTFPRTRTCLELFRHLLSSEHYYTRRMEGGGNCAL